MLAVPFTRMDGVGTESFTPLSSNMSSHLTHAYEGFCEGLSEEPC